MTDGTTTCPECGAPGWDAEERECEICAAIGDLENARGQLAEAIEYEEWGAARNELEYLGEVIDALNDVLDAVEDPTMYGQLVDLLDPAVAQHNAAVGQSNAAGGWR